MKSIISKLSSVFLVLIMFMCSSASGRGAIAIAKLFQHLLEGKTSESEDTALIFIFLLIAYWVIYCAVVAIKKCYAFIKQYL